MKLAAAPLAASLALLAALALSSCSVPNPAAPGASSGGAPSTTVSTTNITSIASTNIVTITNITYIFTTNFTSITNVTSTTNFTFLTNTTYTTNFTFITNTTTITNVSAVSVGSPTFSLPGGTYTNRIAATNISITVTNGGATIFYTIDGSTPTPSSFLYTGPVTIVSNVTLKAMALLSGYSNSPTATAVYSLVLQPTIVTTFAGSGTAGSANGTGVAATFNVPKGLAIDSSGNLYTTEGNNYNVRKITSGAVVTSFAGSAGTAGSNDGTGAAARFYNCNGIVVNSSGNIFVSEYGYYNIRKITSGAVVTTYAGSGVAGYVDGAAASAQFGTVNGIAVDSSGNVFVIDNYCIRKITSGGVVSTFAGSNIGNVDGTGIAARFSATPFGLAVDSSDNLFVTDADNFTIRKVTSAGVVTTFAGTGSTGSNDGVGTSASFARPWAIAIDSSNNIYVADALNYKIRKITSSGIVTTFAGTGVSGSNDGVASSATFSTIWGLAVDASGNVYVADSGNHKIRKITP